MTKQYTVTVSCEGHTATVIVPAAEVENWIKTMCDAAHACKVAGHRVMQAALYEDHGQDALLALLGPPRKPLAVAKEAV